MDWILQNYEWIFGGIGVFFLSLLFQNKRKSIKQKQISGKNSINAQSAKKIIINKYKNDK